MPSPVKLRIGDARCIASVLPLFRAYQAHYSSLTSATEEQTRTFLLRLADHPESGFVIVAEIDDTVVGFATGYFTAAGVIAERLLHLGDLYVSPEYRRRGIATALVDEVVREAVGHGIRMVRWLSLATNTDLNQWYTSLGATSGDFKLFLLPTEKRANKAPEPTTMAVTPRATS
jgi:ribosomal protein S18 acetylase RimI-like enzyme